MIVGENMKILIIGGSTDVGISLAKYFSILDNDVSITYHNHKCMIDGIKCLPLDITNEDELEILFHNNEFDMLINMAAISHDNLFLDNTKEDFVDILKVNLVGTFSASRIFSKYNPTGIIINIASTDGIDTYSEYSMLYSASKAGVINLSKSMALSTKNKVLCICPNWLDASSTINMDQNYLTKELKRIGQSRLISLDEFNQSVVKIIDEYNSRDIIRIDIRDDKLWIEKIS